jgi:hypothetical protein
MAKFEKDDAETMETVNIDSYVSSRQEEKRIIASECIE